MGPLRRDYGQGRHQAVGDEEEVECQRKDLRAPAAKHDGGKGREGCTACYSVGKTENRRC